MDGDEVKKFKNCCVVENIQHPQKIRENDEVRENEGNSSPMSKTRSKQGSEGKWGDHSNVSKTILKQGIEGSLRYCINERMEVRSPMSMTRSKQVSEEKWRYSFNVYKTV